MAAKNIFVYVACGGDEHIDTLNFSIKYLRTFSANPILVVTDTSRNKKTIEHDNILDIKTPEAYNHHQASIYLKTGLYKFVDLQHNYCYLDTDVIAIDKDVNNIFSHFEAPVVFASDHCAIREFSPYAVNCDCNEKKIAKYKILDNLQMKHNPNMLITDDFLKEKCKELINTFYIKKREKIKYIFLMLRYFLSVGHFKLNDDFYYDKKKKIWFYKDNRAILYAISGYYKKIEKESYFRWHNSRQIWLDDTKENAYIAYCDHLSELIKTTFDIDNADKNWHHWNGGVFLFNHKSKDFLEYWHEATLKTFNDSRWKTRDQGTLIASAWKFNLQNHKRLPEIYNFIADYYKKNLSYDKHKGFSTDKFKTLINPCLIHVYHEFGRKDWDVWQAIEERIKKA